MGAPSASPFPFLTLLLPLGMVGMILRSRAAFALLSIPGIYALTLITFFTNMRISFPASSFPSISPLTHDRMPTGDLS